MTWERHALRAFLALQLVAFVVGAVKGYRNARASDTYDNTAFEAVLTVPPDEVDIDTFAALMEWCANNQPGFG